MYNLLISYIKCSTIQKRFFDNDYYQPYKYIINALTKLYRTKYV